MKRFGTQLKELLAGLDKNEKLTPNELITKVKELRASGSSKFDGDIIENALKTPRFVRKIMQANRRSQTGRVVLYTRKGEPMVMTLERMTVLQSTVKRAMSGLREYHDKRRAAVS